MNFAKRIVAFVLVLSLVITMMPLAQANAASKRIKLNRKKATIYVGKTIKLKVKNKKGKKVKWISKNRKVATVSKKGRVKAKKVGKATIIAKVGNKKLKCKITVKKKKNKKPVVTTKPNVVPEQEVTTKPIINEEPTAGVAEETTTQNLVIEESTTENLTTEEPTTEITFTTDSSIAKPFGMVVSSPENGMVNVVWGRGTIDCYNVYVDGERRRTAITAQSLNLPVYFEGTHEISVTTVVGNKESLPMTMTITVVGIGEKETEPETCPPELKPQLREDLELSDDKILMQINNKTDGAFADNEVYWCVIGYNSNKELCYLDKSGNLIPANTDMNTLTVSGRKVADISYTLEEADYVYVPSISSGRMYVSYEKPVYITFNKAADGSIGYAGPDLNNSSDPNIDTLYEFAEFTIDGKYFWGNTTRVDFFCFPMVTRLVGHTQYETYDNTVGEIGTRDEIFEAFKISAPEPFKSLVGDTRIMAPCKTTFNTGKEYGNYFDSYIDEFWTKYTNEDLVFKFESGSFTGRVSGDVINFVRAEDGKTYTVSKPNTQEVLEGKGAFASGNGIEKAIEAQLCAAFNRGVATDPSKWYKPAQYYQNDVNNYYAGFFHKHSIVGRAYGFCYDDVNDQSTLLQYANSDALIIDLKW